MQYLWTILVPSVLLPVSKPTGTVLQHWDPCTHLEAKVQIRENKIFFCLVSVTNKDEAIARGQKQP